MHGDLTGAFRTGLPGSIGKLIFNNKDVLIGGTTFSLLMLWQIHEAGLAVIQKKDPIKPNVFDSIVGKQEEYKQAMGFGKVEEEKEVAPQENKEEEVKLVRNDNKYERELIEPLDDSD